MVISPHEHVTQQVGQMYAGRANATPMIDLLVTLLSMGLRGYQTLLQQRLDMLSAFQQGLAAVAERHGERVLQCSSTSGASTGSRTRTSTTAAANDISFGMTLDTLWKFEYPQETMTTSASKNDDETAMTSASAAAAVVAITTTGTTTATANDNDVDTTAATSTTIIAITTDTAATTATTAITTATPIASAPAGSSSSSNHQSDQDRHHRRRQVTRLGSMLFRRCVSGTRVVVPGEDVSLHGQVFCGFGSSHDAYPHAYLTAACAIGLSWGEMDEFFVRLDKTMTECKRQLQKEHVKKGESMCSS
jgi:hypothetical protein